MTSPVAGSKPAEIAASEIGVPDLIVGADGNAARPRSGIGSWNSRICMSLSMVATFGAPNSTKKTWFLELTAMPYGRAFAVGGWASLNVAGLRIEPADEIAALHGEPDDAVMIDDERVRVAGVRIGQWIFFHFAAASVSSLPMKPRKLPVNQTLPSLSSTRPCGADMRIDRVFLDLTGLRVEAAELVGELAGPPDRAVMGRPSDRADASQASAAAIP